LCRSVGKNKIFPIIEIDNLAENNFILSLVISFENEEIRKICEDDTYALNHYEPNVVNKLKNRLADLESVTFLSEMAFAFSEVKTKGDEVSYTIEFAKKEAILSFTPVGLKKGRSLESVNRIKITDIRILK
jgi:hypothetical protein